MPGMQKGGIADQAGELEPVAKLASQRQIHSFTHQEGRAFVRPACGSHHIQPMLRRRIAVLTG